MEIIEQNKKKVNKFGKLTKKQKEINKKERYMKTKSYENKMEKKKYIEDLKMWVISIKTRDNWTCKICAKYVKESPHDCHAHHILDKKNFKEFSLDLLNGITLCYRCHKVGEKSPHLNALFFVKWLKKNRPEQYFYIMNKISTSEKLNMRNYLNNNSLNK